jgi:hypothetical protein
MNTKFRQLITAVGLSLLLTGLASSVLAEDEERAAGPARSMTVDSVLVNENIVVLDGQRYRWPSRPAGGSESIAEEGEADYGDFRDISELRPGMRIRVTLEASRSRVPTILRVEQDQ